jgi:hypothetical protein
MKRHMIGAVVVAAALFIASPAQASSLFGVTPHLPDMTPGQFQQLRGGGASSVRIGININSTETANGYNWALSDARIHAAGKAGLQPIILLSGLPDYTAANAARWRDFVHAAVQHYAASIWIAGNEPNMSWSWSGTIAQYAQLVQDTTNIIHAYRPTALVFVGGTSPVTGINYLNAVLNRIDRASVAGVCVHPYGNLPSGSVNIVRQYRAVLVNHGMANKRILIDEVGWRSDTIGELTQASYLRQFFASMRNVQTTWHVFRVLWYGYQDAPDGHVPLDRAGGLFRSNGIGKPAWAGFKAFAGAP